jgi:phenylacetate-CoA ligase
VISCYPTNLKALVELKGSFRRDNLHLAVVHSEYSSRPERQAWARELGVPVRNEYSTEEATRIALELPCGHQHVCEDAVHLEVLRPDTHLPVPDGQPGLAVVTNLLNEAMPFVRYVQGDYVTRPPRPEPCLVGWSQLASIDGRVNDSFVNLAGQATPAGTILDVVYRWMFDAGLQIPEFELVQTAPDSIRATFIPDAAATEARMQGSVGHLRDLLAVCLGQPVEVVADYARAVPRRQGKRRPIRREFTA